MEKLKEYAVLSNDYFNDLMIRADRFVPALVHEETQAGLAWIKRHGCYIEPMRHLSMLPTNETLERLFILPSLFSQFPIYPGVIRPDLYDFVKPLLLSAHSFGCVFQVSDEIISAKIEIPGGKKKLGVREIISLSRELTGEEFGNMKIFGGI